jgi:hypothetical protein
MNEISARLLSSIMSWELKYLFTGNLSSKSTIWWVGIHIQSLSEHFLLRDGFGSAPRPVDGTGGSG